MEENAEEFLTKIKNRDENTFKEIVKAILHYKNENLTQEEITKKFEDILANYPDLLEEAYLFADYKKINNANLKKINCINKSNNSSANVKSSSRVGTHSPSSDRRDLQLQELTKYPPKLAASPDMVLFKSLQNIFDEDTYKILIKLLYLYVEGILTQHEFTEMIEPYFKNQTEMLEYLKVLTYSKIFNRRQHAIFDRPMCEIDFSKTRKITGYYELPKEYPILISSGRTKFEKEIFNDRLITIPTGSEDDKNPMKKNHYEENLFRFEDQRYEIDMQIEIFQFAVDCLLNLKKKLQKLNKTNITQDELTKEIGRNNVRLIHRYYRYRGDYFIQSLCTNPLDVIDIISKRFISRIESTKEQKVELEKNIKTPFDRIYAKSFDYRSFKFKNFDKKNNNAKAFLKEIITRKKEKTTTSNLNVLKGGTDNSEFFTTLNLKYMKDNVLKKTKDISSLILLNEIQFTEPPNFKKKLPELKIIFENLDILKLTIGIVYYQVFNLSSIPEEKIIEYFNPIFLYLFGLDLTDLVENLKVNSNFVNDKNNNYTQAIEKIKNRKALSEDDYKKFYQLDNLAKSIKEINVEEYLKNHQSKNDEDKESSVSQMSLSPSLLSQDNGRTFRAILCFGTSDNLDSTKSNSNSSSKNDKKRKKSSTKSAEKQTNDSIKIDNTERVNQLKSDEHLLFYPPKCDGDVIFYANENCFIFLRYVFCIYERLNKLNEYSTENESTLIDMDNKDKMEIEDFQKNSPDSIVFKNFVIIYKALILKKIENTSIYEELCRDILGNEAYFLFNMDKLISSLIKTMTLIINDNLSKDIINLFKTEINRKLAPNEKLYLSHYIMMLDNTSMNNFRFLMSPSLNVMTIHLMEVPPEQNKKDYMEQFKEFLHKTLQTSYKDLYDSYKNDEDDPFDVFFVKNKEANVKSRKSERPDLLINNLIFRFDYATKKLHYLKSGEDVMLWNRGEINEKHRLKTKVEKNIKFMAWLNKDK